MLHAFNLISLNPCPKGAEEECCYLLSYLKTKGKTCKDCLNNCKEVAEYWKKEEV